MEIVPGQSATLQNLVASSDLNGEEVEILHWVKKSKRWAVRRASGALLSVRPDNLQVMETSSDPSTLEETLSCLSGGHLVLEVRDGRGRCVIATKLIKAGSVLFREEPFLTMPIRGNSIDTRADADFANKAFADKKLKALITQLYDGGDCRSSFMDRADAVALLAAGKADPAWLRRWRRIWSLNCFRYHQHNQALFLGGSLLNHSCAPNALYQTTSGNLRHSFERCGTFRLVMK